MAYSLIGLPKKVWLKAPPVTVVLAALLCFSSTAAWAAPLNSAEAKGAEAAQLSIKVDQVGYPLNGPKVALVSAPADAL